MSVDPTVEFCNLCGESCQLDGDIEASGTIENCGLIRATASGGFDSTPGNGRGALDDTTEYEFSLCEFCLDFLFESFKRPPRCFDTVGTGQRAEEEDFVPARGRLARDAWRNLHPEYKESFERETLRRTRRLRIVPREGAG